MAITYYDIRHKLQPPLDCSEIGDLRGQYFHNRRITNYENTDFTGCVLYHCFPSGMPNALEINPAQSESDLTSKGVNLSRVDLTGAFLRGADLEGASLYKGDLTRVDLEGANLKGVDLTRAILAGANLSGADLEGANLKEAYLWDANLSGTVLVGANLSGATLQGADLQGADLQGADLEVATYNSKTNFKYSSITQEQKDSMTFVEDEVYL